jgi:uncharacterized protein
MKIRQDRGGLWILAGFPGEDVRTEIEALCKREGISGARVTAIGGVKDPEIAYYNLETRKYDAQVYPGVYELISGLGNVTLLDGKPFLHMHVAISGPDHRVVGGHMMNMQVGVFLEAFIDPLAERLEREMYDAIGLPAWSPFCGRFS